MMDKAYVSDFEHFMVEYLEQHPEVVAEQQRGWASFWDLKIFPDTMHISKANVVRDEHYGFC